MESGKYIIRFETPISIMYETSWIDKIFIKLRIIKKLLFEK